MNRKSTPKVRDGRVQKKNKWARTPTLQLRPGVPRHRPAAARDRLPAPPQAARHRGLLAILPNWAELSQGLNAIVLAPGEDAMGWHAPGVVHLCAWEEELWWDDTGPRFIDDHREIFERLGVAVEKRGDRTIVKWTEGQARAFELLHVLLHELGHHHDRMTTRSRRDSARGEPYAEEYALRYEAQIRDEYLLRFGLD